MSKKVEQVAEPEVERCAMYPDEVAEELRYIPKAERDKIADEDFAWPDAPGGPKYPCDTQDHVDSCATLLGQAPENMQEKIKARAKRIAKRHGFSIPKSWEEEDGKKEEERAMEPGTQGVTASDRAYMYMPITRAVTENNDWIVEGQSTSDTIDTYRTIFDYESSKKAMDRWRGNVREQHDAKKAVGRGIKWTPFDDERRIVLRSLVSKGAPDTWQKVQDGVLTGYSVALKPGYKTKYVERNGERFLCYYDFDYAEISLVDNPGSPGCDIMVVRADGVITDVVDTSEEPVATPPVVQNVSTPEVERAGARMSAESRSALHEMRDKAMTLCGCDECKGMGEPSDGKDDDADEQASRVMAMIEQRLQPTIMRYQAIASRFAAIGEPHIDLSPIERSLETLSTRLEAVEKHSSQDEVRSALAEVKGLVERIAAQPAPGGPILNAADKRLATQPYAGMQPANELDEKAALLRELSKKGILETSRQQTAAAAMMLRPIGG